MAFAIANPPGLFDVPSSQLASGQLSADWVLVKALSNAKFGAVAVELFYAEAKDGDTVAAPRSTADQYQYSMAECVVFRELRTTLNALTGKAGAPGGILLIETGFDSATGKVGTFVVYDVPGGNQQDTNNGLLALWCFAVRGRGDLTLASAPAFNYVPPTQFPLDAAVTATKAQQLSEDARLSAVRFEVFIDNGSGAAKWMASVNYTVGTLVKPTAGRANGLWYKCVAAGVSGPYEPRAWPGTVGQQIVDGGATWQAVGFGYTNGQTVPLPVSPVDGYAYSRAEVSYLKWWVYTGKTDLSGASGPGVIRLLSKSVNASTGVVTAQVNYWDGKAETVTNDGILGVITVCQRTIAAGAMAAQATPFTDIDAFTFAADAPLPDTPTSQLITDVNFAILRPEAMVANYVNGNTVALLTSPVDSYPYARTEQHGIWQVDNTGTGQGIIRSIDAYVNPADGSVHCEVDFLKAGGGIAQGFDATVPVMTVARRAHANIDPVSTAVPIAAAASQPATPDNLIVNPGFERWSNPANAAADGWTVSTKAGNSSSGRVAGIVGDYGQGLTVSTAGAGNSVGATSTLAAIAPGHLIFLFLQALASAATTAGFYVRLHFIDATLALDTTLDLVANGALLATAKIFKARFITPANGDSTVQTNLGSGALSATLTYTPAYLQLELINLAPNVANTTTVDAVVAKDWGEVGDVIDPTLPGILSGVRVGSPSGPRIFGAPTNLAGWEGTPVVNANDWFNGPIGRIRFGSPDWRASDPNVSGVDVDLISSVGSALIKRAAANWITGVTNDSTGFNGTPAISGLDVFAGNPTVRTNSDSSTNFRAHSTGVGSVDADFYTGLTAAGIAEMARAGTSRYRINATGHGFERTASTFPMEAGVATIQEIAATPLFRLDDTTAVTGKNYGIMSGSIAGDLSVRDATNSLNRLNLSQDPEFGFFGSPLGNPTTISYAGAKSFVQGSGNWAGAQQADPRVTQPTHTTYKPLTNPLTSASPGTSVSVAAFSMRVGGVADISLNSGTVSGLTAGTLYFIYYDDAGFAGGAVTYQATTTREVAIQGTGRFFVGSIVTAVSGGATTNGNKDGGNFQVDPTGSKFAPVSGWAYDWTNLRTALFDTLQTDWMLKTYPGINLDDAMAMTASFGVTITTTAAVNIPTVNGNWNATAAGSNGTVTPGGGLGGDIELDTGATSLSRTQLQAGGGASPWFDPSAAANSCFYGIVDILGTTNRRIRIGVTDTNADPPDNGIFFKFDSAVSANWITETRAGAVSTTNTSGVAAAGGKREFLIVRDSAGVKFYTRLGKTVAWTLLFTHTTNIPTTGLIPIFQCVTTSAAAVGILVYHCIAASLIED